MLVDHPTWYVVIATGIWGEETTPKGGSDPQGSFPNCLIAINLILENFMILQQADLLYKFRRKYVWQFKLPFSTKSPNILWGDLGDDIPSSAKPALMAARRRHPPYDCQASEIAGNFAEVVHHLSFLDVNNIILSQVLKTTRFYIKRCGF